MTFDNSNDPASAEYNLTMSQSHFDSLTTSVRNSIGSSLQELAAERPIDAFRILEAFIGIITHSSTDGVVNLNGIGMSSQMDGHQAVVGMIKNIPTILGCNPDIIPIEVTISVYPPRRLSDMLLRRPTATKQVLSFKVLPPNLAP